MLENYFGNIYDEFYEEVVESCSLKENFYFKHIEIKIIENNIKYIYIK